MTAIRVKVRYFSFFQDITGRAEEYACLEDRRVWGLLRWLAEKYGSKQGQRAFALKGGQDRMEYIISLNGKAAHLQSLLNEEDEVSFIPPMGGG